MINSKQLMEQTGISRATLNNYVALGILPSPRIGPADNGVRATRVGYFPDEAVERIRQVRNLKGQGKTMADIAKTFGNAPSNDPAPDRPVEQRAERRQSSTDYSAAAPALTDSDTSLDSLPGPAYMVNNNFELTWWNDCAAQDIFFNEDLLDAGDSRSLLRLLLERGDSEIRATDTMLQDILRPHLAVARKRLGQQSLFKLYTALDSQHLSLLERIDQETPTIGREPVVRFDSLYFDREGREVRARLYVSMFREGILFSYCPLNADSDALLRFLGHRHVVIRELMKRRKPHLSPVAVMVADLQNSVRICSELPPEEYFELINSIWQESEPVFRKYYATYGKHAGDGMVYYFFPQPDCDYVANAIQCAIELRDLMRNFTQHWLNRKGWFNDLHLNIGLHEGQEWFGTFSAGPHVEFTVLGETVNYAARISDFARDGAIWVSKSMLGKLPRSRRKRVHYGIYQSVGPNERHFVPEMYSSIQHMSGDDENGNPKFRQIETMPITEIRGLNAG